VSVKYGEYLNEAGSVECENILASGQAQVDRLEFAAASEGLTWQPEFTYKGFRYVAVRLEGGVELSDITAIPYVSRLEETGSFDCDEQTLCWIENATAATLLNNLHGVPTDTPCIREERLDGRRSPHCRDAMRRFDLRSLLNKWLDDHVDSADEMGVVPQIVPTPGWGRRIDPTWSGSLILLAWNLYWEYGDSEVIHRYLKPMTRYLDRALRSLRMPIGSGHCTAGGTGWLPERGLHQRGQPRCRPCRC
jgi:alpha-L-rhamnosidase